jgi:hypothetical protein
VALDTLTACPDLTGAERAIAADKVERAKTAVAAEAKTVRKAWADARAHEIAVRTNKPVHVVRQQLESAFAGRLEPIFLLHFDHLGSVSVAQILADPERYVGATLRDPSEPETQGEQCAKLFRGERDGTLFIKSFAHGGQYFHLVHDYESLAAMIERTPVDTVFDRLTEAFPSAQLSDIEAQRISDLAQVKAGYEKRKADYKRLMKPLSEKRGAKKPQPKLPAIRSRTASYGCWSRMRRGMLNGCFSRPPSKAWDGAARHRTLVARRTSGASWSDIPTATGKSVTRPSRPRCFTASPRPSVSSSPNRG